MNQIVENNHVQNIVQFKQVYKELVPKLVQMRSESGITQEFISDWFGVDRRRIIQFEGLKKVNLELLFIYADKFDIETTFNYKIH